MTKRLVTVSKFLSKYLRHEPEALDLVLEPGGWVSVDDLLAGASNIGFSIREPPARLKGVVRYRPEFSFVGHHNADPKRG